MPYIFNFVSGLNFRSTPMNSAEPTLSGIKQKINALALQKKELAQRVASLEKEITRLEDSHKEKLDELESMAEKNKVLTMAKALKSSDQEATASKHKINELVREIDRCIALLNK